MTARRTARTAILLLAIGSLVAASGCYKRVVRSKGFGASEAQVYEGTNIPKSTKKSNTAHNRKADWNY